MESFAATWGAHLRKRPFATLNRKHDYRPTPCWNTYNFAWHIVPLCPRMILMPNVLSSSCGHDFLNFHDNFCLVYNDVKINRSLYLENVLKCDALNKQLSYWTDLNHETQIQCLTNLFERDTPSQNSFVSRHTRLPPLPSLPLVYRIINQHFY